MNEALSDAVTDTLDYSMRQELEGVLRVGQRIAAAMVRWVVLSGWLWKGISSSCKAGEPVHLPYLPLRGLTAAIGAVPPRYFTHRQSLAATANALCLAKSLKQRMWDDSKQVGGACIGRAHARVCL